MRLYNQFGHPVPVHNHPLSKMLSLCQVGISLATACENHFLSFHSVSLRCSWICHLYDHHPHPSRDSNYIPLSLLFSRVNKPSPLSSSLYIRCLDFLTSLVALHRTPSTSVVADRPQSGCRIQKWRYKCWCSPHAAGLPGCKGAGLAWAQPIIHQHPQVLFLHALSPTCKVLWSCFVPGAGLCTCLC